MSRQIQIKMRDSKECIPLEIAENHKHHVRDDKGFESLCTAFVQILGEEPGHKKEPLHHKGKTDDVDDSGRRANAKVSANAQEVREDNAENQKGF